MEENLIFLKNGRHPQFFGEIEDDLNVKKYGRQPQFKRKWKKIWG
jgi:hypothetical protein